MNQKLHFLLFVSLFAALAGLGACDNSDDFSADISLKLSFSADTIKFEKALTTIKTATKIFTIRNQNEKSLTISSVELMHPEISGFSLRVDNENGKKFTDVDVLKKDSIFVFVDITALKGCPPIIRDSIRFITNGNVQYVQLEAIGQEVHIWKGKRITSDTILTSAIPFLIYDSLIVDKNRTLTLEKGVQFYFHYNALFHVYGRVEAMGSASEKIVLRGDRFDNIEANIPYDNVPGRWHGIVFSGDSHENLLENVVIKNTVNGVYFEPSKTQSKKATLHNTVIQNSYGYGLCAINCNLDAANCLFANTGNATVSITGGSYSFTHCTMANYFAWKSRQQQALKLSNTYRNETYPLVKCEIINTVIYGSLKDELSFKFDSSTKSEYLFRNCLIASPKKEDNHFINIIWNSAPLFSGINRNGKYDYDFHLQKNSPAIDKADKNYSLPYPSDIDGNARLNDFNPDIGCYEWYPQ